MGTWLQLIYIIYTQNTWGPTRVLLLDKTHHLLRFVYIIINVIGDPHGYFFFVESVHYSWRKKKNEFINNEIDLYEIEAWLTGFNCDCIMHNWYISL